MVFILIKYIKLLKALASSVFNDKILAFSTPNTEKLTTSHVQNAKIFGMDEQYHSTKQYGKNTKILVFFFFNSTFLSLLPSLSLSLLLLFFLSHPLPHSYCHRPHHHAADLKSLSRSLFHSKPLHSLTFGSLFLFRLSISLPLGYWLVVVGRLIVAVMVFKFCVLCFVFFFFFLLQWWWIYLIFTRGCFLVGF